MDDQTEILEPFSHENLAIKYLITVKIWSKLAAARVIESRRQIISKDI